MFVLGGVSFDANSLESVTRDFVDLKAALKPEENFRHKHDYLKELLPELKGSALRSLIREHGDAPASTLASDALSATLAILEAHRATIVGFRHKFKDGEKALGERAYYRSVEHICKTFNNRLADRDEYGFVVLDNRDSARNKQVSHAIYVQKFRGADKLPRIIDAPTFGESDNHAGLQIADIVCSGLLASIAAGDEAIKTRFGRRVADLQRDVLTA